MPAPSADLRKSALEQWIATQIGESLNGEPASSDASFRRYFRFHTTQGARIAMDAPPERENCAPFLQMAALLRQCGVHVPQVLAQDLEQGFLLLEDLGTQTYLDVFASGPSGIARADELFADALQALIAIQRHPPVDTLPRYDEALLRRELALFPDWYLQRHCGLTIDRAWQRTLDTLFRQLVDSALAQPCVLVHRDYMPRNLMLSAPNPGVLDFQDAVWGPISYDPVCLFRDAFFSWPEPRVEAWLRDYWQQAREVALPVPASFEQFQRDADWMGAQRHLKVIGIFARICHRDGKPRYLQDVPRFFTYLHHVAARYPELGALVELLDRLEGLRA